MAPRRPFVVDPALTAIAIGYRNEAYTLIADQVLPRVTVGGEKFKWTKFNAGERLTVPNTRVGRTGAPNRVEFSGTEVDDSVDDYGLDVPIPNSDITEAARLRAQGHSLYDPEAEAVEGLADLMLLDREVRIAGIVHNAATYAAGRKVTLSGTSQLSDYTNSTPIPVLKTAIEGTLGPRPNTVVMGFSVWSKLSSHPHIVNAIRGNLTNQGIVTREEFARLFEIKNLLVGESFVNTARKGQTEVLSRVWGKHIAVLHLNPMASRQRSLTFGFTAQYGSKVSGRIEDEDIGLQGGTRIRNGERIKELIVAQDCGYFIENAVA